MDARPGPAGPVHHRPEQSRRSAARTTTAASRAATTCWCYTSEPLAEPLEVTGPVRLVAHFAASAADTDFTAKLLDVHPDGFAQRLCDGMVRLRYRDGFGAEQPVTAGETYEVEIRMWDTCVRVPAGHRLRVEIASSAFPKFDVNLGTGGDMITETEGVIATNRLWHTPSHPSRLILN